MSDSNFGGLDDMFGADKDLQSSGKWVDCGNVSVLLAFAGKANPKYEVILEKRVAPIQRFLKSPKLMKHPDVRKQVEEAMITAYAEAVVLNWRGVTRGGDEVKYTPAEGKKAMIELPGFWEFIREYASELENYQTEELEDASGNF